MISEITTLLHSPRALRKPYRALREPSSVSRKARNEKNYAKNMQSYPGLHGLFQPWLNVLHWMAHKGF